MAKFKIPKGNTEFYVGPVQIPHNCAPKLTQITLNNTLFLNENNIFVVCTEY